MSKIQASANTCSVGDSTYSSVKRLSEMMTKPRKLGKPQTGQAGEISRWHAEAHAQIRSSGAWRHRENPSGLR